MKKIKLIPPFRKFLEDTEARNEFRSNNQKLKSAPKNHELVMAERHLDDIQAEMDNYPNKSDLIGRALRDLRDRARHMLYEARKTS